MMIKGGNLATKTAVHGTVM